MRPLELIQMIGILLRQPDAGWKMIRDKAFTWQQVYFYYAIPFVALSSLSYYFYMAPEALKLGLSPNLMFVSNVLSRLGAIALGALVIQKLSPRYQAKSDFHRLTALITFAYTPVFLSSLIVILHPALTFVGLVGLVYMVFLFWKGVVALVDVPPHKAMGFTIICLLIVFGATLILAGTISAIILTILGAELPSAL